MKPYGARPSPWQLRPGESLRIRCEQERARGYTAAQTAARLGCPVRDVLRAWDRQDRVLRSPVRV